MSGIQITALTPGQAAEKWEFLKGWIVAACEKDIEGKISAGGLYDDVMTSQSLAIEICMHGQPVGVAIVCSSNVKNGRCLFVQALGGVIMYKWLADFVRFLEVTATAAGCVDGILFVGRPGWKKELNGLGFNTVLVTMHKGLEK